MRNEEQVWEFVNKARKKRRDITEKLDVKEWKGYFKGLLEGKEELEERRRVGKSYDYTGRGDELTEEDIMGVMKKLKKRKAARGDDIKNEA